MAFGSDTFTDTDGVLLDAHTPNLGGPWVLHPEGACELVIKTNRARANDFDVWAYYFDETPPSANYKVTADLVDLGSAWSVRICVNARMSSSASTYYRFGHQVYFGWILEKTVAGTNTQLAADMLDNPGAGTYPIELRVNGTTISGYVSGSLKHSVTDSSISAAGFAGVSGDQMSPEGIGWQLDNWVADTLTTAVNLAAVIAGKSTVAAAATRGVRLSTTIAGKSTVAAAATRGVLLSTTIAGKSTVAASVSSSSGLAAVIAGKSTVAAALTRGVLLASAIAGRSTVAAAATRGVLLASAISGRSTVAAAATRGVQLASAISGKSTVAAAASVSKNLSAVIQGRTSIFASLTGGLATATNRLRTLMGTGE